MDIKREGKLETGEGRRRGKRARAKESTTEVTGDLKGKFEIRHMMDNMRYLYCNGNPGDLKGTGSQGGTVSDRMLWIHAGDAGLDSSF